MSQPDWAKILSYLHEHNGEIGTEPDGDEWTSQEESEQAFNEMLRETIDLDDPSDGSITTAREHMEDKGLVTSRFARDYVGMELTTDGFNVAHERELARRNSRINRSLAAFTLVLVIITGVDVAPVGQLVKGVAIVSLLVAVLIAEYHFNTFDL